MGSCPLRCKNNKYRPGFLCRKLISELKIKCKCDKVYNYFVYKAHKKEKCKNESSNQNINNEMQLDHQSSLLPSKILNNLQLIEKGNDIDMNTYHEIVISSYISLNNREDPLSNAIIRKLKSRIGGEWFVFACINYLKGFDFSITLFKKNEFLRFNIMNYSFQVLRIIIMIIFVIL